MVPNRMSTLAVEAQEPRVQEAQIGEETLILELVDGRTVTVPLAWYPRLWYGSQEERSRFEIIGDGSYIHWPELDEDLSVTGILAGRRSGESPESLKKWLAGRDATGRGRQIA
jgi:hypothetical protein